MHAMKFRTRTSDSCLRRRLELRFFCEESELSSVLHDYVVALEKGKRRRRTIRLISEILFDGIFPHSGHRLTNSCTICSYASSSPDTSRLCTEGEV